MPSKTIYVSDGDAALFRRAQELAGGNLSGAIATALARYVEVEEARLDGYEEITVTIGTGARRKARFVGVLLGEWGRQSAAGRVEVFRVYRTRAGRYAVHADRSPDVSWKSGASATSGGSGSGGGWRDYLGYLGLGEQTWSFVQGEATFDVADSLEELRDKLPEEFYKSIAGADGEPAVEYLDI
ncbi:EXLDI protein [Streptomyces tuirus]|uniref:EXLDI protein n=1 Tax=Streptomyces tuirus TaxID=68278 RepID=A0A941FBI5_9ACTN|nr:EXLDI protein [Streptomyces tuirus]